MGLVVLDMSMSLDGFVAGPNVGVDRPMGEGGERLHAWMWAGRTEREAAAFEQELLRPSGAFVVGRRTFELGEGPWGDDTFHVPLFVLAHEPRPPLEKDRPPSRSSPAGSNAPSSRRRPPRGTGRSR